MQSQRAQAKLFSLFAFHHGGAQHGSDCETQGEKSLCGALGLRGVVGSRAWGAAPAWQQSPASKGADKALPQINK